jgi:hypothetical protein
MPMTAYLVSVRIANEGRYIDSIWISEFHASQRRDELLSEFNRLGHETVVN